MDVLLSAFYYHLLYPARKTLSLSLLHVERIFTCFSKMFKHMYLDLILIQRSASGGLLDPQLVPGHWPYLPEHLCTGMCASTWTWNPLQNTWVRLYLLGGCWWQQWAQDMAPAVLRACLLHRQCSEATGCTTPTCILQLRTMCPTDTTHEPDLLLSKWQVLAVNTFKQSADLLHPWLIYLPSSCRR